MDTIECMLLCVKGNQCIAKNTQMAEVLLKTNQKHENLTGLYNLTVFGLMLSLVIDI